MEKRDLEYVGEVVGEEFINYVKEGKFEEAGKTVMDYLVGGELVKEILDMVGRDDLFEEWNKHIFEDNKFEKLEKFMKERCGEVGREINREELNEIFEQIMGGDEIYKYLVNRNEDGSIEDLVKERIGEVFMKREEFIIDKFGLKEYKEKEEKGECVSYLEVGNFIVYEKL